MELKEFLKLEVKTQYLEDKKCLILVTNLASCR